VTDQTEDEMEDLLEENLCLKDDLEQLKGDLEEARKRASADERVCGLLAEFMYYEGRSSGREGARDTYELARSMGFDFQETGNYYRVTTGRNPHGYTPPRQYQRPLIKLVDRGGDDIASYEEVHTADRFLMGSIKP